MALNNVIRETKQRSFTVNITDLRINAVSKLNAAGNYTAAAGQIAEIDFEVRKNSNGTVAPTNANVYMILGGLFGASAKVLFCDFTAGVATASVTLVEGVFELTGEGVNFAARNNPDLQLDFFQKSVFVVRP